MTRLLLAFLALLGIVAQAAPAGARPCGEVAQVRLIAASTVASASLAARSVAAAPRLGPVREAAFEPGFGAISLPAFTPAPAVLIKVDRARE